MKAAPKAAEVQGAPRGEAGELFQRCYRELHRLARRQLQLGPRHAGLSATTLLHEAYLHLSDSDAVFADRQQFFAYAARAMRGLVIDFLRERQAQKRGGAFEFVTLDTEVEDTAPALDAVEQLGDALQELEHSDAALAQLVDLKFFCGFSFAEIAAMRSVSERTVQRDWAKARLVLRHLVGEA
jgi:RNA polymerase sigma factor (TIGR02999 family)